jgi:putative hemolysin
MILLRLLAISVAGPIVGALTMTALPGTSPLGNSLPPSLISPGRHGSGQVLGRMGNLEVRLARNSSEIAAAQEVRFQVFYDELGAKRSQVHTLEARDADRFDDVCDHIIVCDTDIHGPDHRRIVGTYRLLPAARAGHAGGLYSEGEYDIAALIARHRDRNFLELGRSCVLPAYRTKRSVELLWQGIWAYCRATAVDVMIGCASFPGTVPARHATALSFLAQNCRADPLWDAKAKPARRVEMDLVPTEAIDVRQALGAMPPMIKGYLRLGARVGDGAVIDRDFATTDVLIILPVEHINPRYVAHYGTDADRYAERRGAGSGICQNEDLDARGRQ